jgi:hypothetical protein
VPPRSPFEDEETGVLVTWVMDLFVACVAAACTGVVFAFTASYGVSSTGGSLTTSTESHVQAGHDELLGSGCGVCQQGVMRWAALAVPIFLIVLIDEVLDNRFRSLVHLAF